MLRHPSRIYVSAHRIGEDGLDASQIADSLSLSIHLFIKKITCYMGLQCDLVQGLVGLSLR
jgi:hypothetical protein